MKKWFTILLVLAFGNVLGQNIWTVYNSANSGLPNNTLWYVNAGPGDTIWVSSWGGGMAKFFNGTTQQIFNTSNSPILSNLATPIFFDNNNDLLLGTENGGFGIYNGTAWNIYTISNSGLQSNIIYDFEQETNNTLWAATRFGGLTKWDGTNWTTYTTSNSQISHNILYALQLDLNEDLWIGAYSGLNKFDGTTWTKYFTSNSPLPDNSVYALAMDAAGAIWIGTFGGLAKFDGVNWTVYTTSNSGLPFNYIRQLKFDSSGNLWIATGGGGLAMFDGTNWITYNTSNTNLPHNNIFSIDFDSNGILWVATYGGGLATLAVNTLQPFADVCIDTPPFTLTGGSPAGGTYSGPGVTNNIIDPSIAGIGTHTILYIVNNDTITGSITVLPLPSVSLNLASPVDITTSPIALTGGSPSGGTYSGPGVSSGMFDPSVAGLGTHTITYTYTDSLGCIGSATAIITVNQTVVVTLDPFADVCVDDTPFSLSGGSPSGGLYAGPGITNGLFDPSMAGVGTHTIVYTVNNTSASQDITVNALPVVTLASFPNVDVTTAAFTLTGGIPSGGIYSGPGVSNGMFDPAVAGIGTHSIIYNYTDSNGCSNSASATITVDPAVVVTLDPIIPLCVNASAITLTGGLPTGGVYSGTGVANGMFNPSAAGVGTHTITYTFNGQSASQTITINPLPVVTLSISGGTIGCDNTIIIGYNNTPIVITATSSTAVNYQWYHDNNLIIGANSSTLNVTTGGTYSVSVTDINGCLSDPNAPGAIINFNGINANCGNNNNKVLLCHYPPGNNGNPQTLCISANAVPAHIANHPGDCIGPCPGARLSTPVTESIHYHISPNPVTDKAELSFMTFRSGNVKIDLLDLLGRSVRNVYNELTEGDIEYTIEIDAAGIIAGVYFIRIKSPDGVVTEKFTIVK